MRILLVSMAQVLGIVRVGARTQFIQLVRSAYTSSGAVVNRPVRPYGLFPGLLGVGTVIVPMLYIGGRIAMQVASTLEEYELVIPDDDD